MQPKLVYKRRGGIRKLKKRNVKTNDRCTYRFVSEAFGNQLDSLNWYGCEGMTYNITDDGHNLFTNIFIIVQQPITKRSWKLICIIRIEGLRTKISGDNETRISYRLFEVLRL